jgi:hypothetical protein
MNCEANGCTAALTPKAIPGSAADVAAGIPSPWVVTDIPPGWCVRQVENTDLGSSRLVVLCRMHSAGVVKPADALLTGAEFLAVADAAKLTGDLDELADDDGHWNDPHLEVARQRARIAELEGGVARLTEIAATADADRVPLAMDLEISQARVAELEQALRKVGQEEFHAPWCPGREHCGGRCPVAVARAALGEEVMRQATDLLAGIKDDAGGTP